MADSKEKSLKNWKKWLYFLLFAIFLGASIGFLWKKQMSDSQRFFLEEAINLSDSYVNTVNEAEIFPPKDLYKEKK